MHNKKAYLAFSRQHGLPLHLQPHWLDAVCQGGQWDVCLSYDGEGNIQGALPFFLRKRWGLSLITMPPFTDYLGPYLRLPDNPTMKPERQSTLEQRILADLVKQLPPVDFFNQQYYPELKNWLPFYWQGYRQTTVYTYRIGSLANLDQIYQNVKHTVRTDLKKADRQLSVESSDDLLSFIRLNRLSFARQNIAYPFNPDTLKKLDQALTTKKQRTIYFAKDKTGQPCGGLYVAWDHHTTYCLLSGLSPKGASQAAMHLLYWQAICDASRQVKQLDFCGSMLPGVEHLFRSFGAVRVPHFRIFRTRNKLLRVAAILSGKDY